MAIIEISHAAKEYKPGQITAGSEI